MAAHNYGRYYWCIKVTRDVSSDGEILLSADEITVGPEACLIAMGSQGQPVLVIAPRKWTSFYAASCMDGHAVAVDHWASEIAEEWSTPSTKRKRVLDSQRSFSPEQREAILRRSRGKCSICGIDLPENWHADHIVPHSRGGSTRVENGMALCPTCNGRKHAKVLTVEE